MIFPLSVCVIFLLIKQSVGCRLLVPSEFLNGCIFDPMIVSVSHAGFSITRENCNAVVGKDVFAEQPLVYYGRARSVKYSDSEKKILLVYLYFVFLFQDRTYTVMMIDPDYPHYKTGEFYLHWLVTNVPVRINLFYILMVSMAC